MFHFQLFLNLFTSENGTIMSAVSDTSNTGEGVDENSTIKTWMQQQNLSMKDECYTKLCEEGFETVYDHTLYLIHAFFF